MGWESIYLGLVVEYLQPPYMKEKQPWLGEKLQWDSREGVIISFITSCSILIIFISSWNFTHSSRLWRCLCQNLLALYSMLLSLILVIVYPKLLICLIWAMSERNHYFHEVMVKRWKGSAPPRREGSTTRTLDTSRGWARLGYLANKYLRPAWYYIYDAW